jgi:tripartite-type tricarboxylate transporter receptor subunit TctC
MKGFGQAALALLLLADQAAAQSLPDRPISLLVGTAPGGSTDVSARLLAEPLGKALGRTIVIENKAGASGNIAASQVARAKPDGATLLMQYSGSHTINPHIFKTMPWSPKDFVPVAIVAVSPHAIATHPGVKAANLRELAELARAKPSTVTYGSAGIGSVNHVAMELFTQITGTKMLHVPYRGSAPSVTDLLGGRIDLVNTTLPSLAPHIRAGTLNGLAFLATKRHPAFPEIPTSAEAGMPDYLITSWFAVMAPAGTPSPLVERLAAEIRTVVESEEFRRKIEEQGGFAEFRGPADVEAAIARELDYWGTVVRTAGIKADE